MNFTSKPLGGHNHELEIPPEEYNMLQELHAPKTLPKSFKLQYMTWKKNEGIG